MPLLTRYLLNDTIFLSTTREFRTKACNGPLLISLALVISRFVDMVTDPVVGFLSDKVNTRWGRRIPFIAVGIIPLALFTIAFFYPPMNNEKLAFIYLAIVGSMSLLFIQ